MTQPFAPGEKLTCLIGLPVRSASSHESFDRLYLEADVEVVRIVIWGSGFGIGCRICEYRVLANDAIPTWGLRQKEQPFPIIEQLV